MSGWKAHMPVIAKGLALVVVVASAAADAADDLCAMGTNNAPSSARRTVVLTSKEIDFSTVDFSLGRTLGRLVDTGGKTDSPAARASLLESLIATLRQTSFVNPVGGTKVEVEARPEGKDLTAAQLLDPDPVKGMHPVALFNRFDLSPQNFENCGEYRIVYMLGKPQTATRRMTLIFEARVANPHPELAHRGCLDIAKFWKSMEGKSPADAAKAVEAFYYAGKMDDGTAPLPIPVVDFENYGFARGQVRGNLFVTPDPGVFKWQLREWHTDFAPDGSPVLRAEPVKDTPIHELWGTLPAGSPLTGLQKDFAAELVTVNLNRLLQPDRGAGSDKVTFVADVGAEFNTRFDDFESVSQGSQDEPSVIITEPLKGRLNAALDGAATPKPSLAQLLNRAGAVTCGGCHQFSNGDSIGNLSSGEEITWPASGGFVHTQENGDLSPALLESFLVFRCRRQDAYLANPDAFKPRESVRVAVTGPDVKAFIARMKEESATERADGLSALRLEARAMREAEAQEPGAFVAVRRVH